MDPRLFAALTALETLAELTEKAWEGSVDADAIEDALFAAWEVINAEDERADSGDWRLWQPDSHARRQRRRPAGYTAPTDDPFAVVANMEG